MNKTVLITGASRGIGEACARYFAGTQKYNLVITCQHSADSLLSLAEELEQMSSLPCLPVIGDIADPAFVTELFENVTEKFGGVDILINNAGISHVGLLQDMTVDEWNRLVAVNLTSVFTCSKCAIPHMIRQKRGRILNISSVWGNVGASCEVCYSATKGGVNAFTKALAKELAPSGIQVNAIACGCIDTAMNDCFSADEKNALAEEIPVGRFGTAKEVAALAGYFAETAPDYLTGQILTLDGGWI